MKPRAHSLKAQRGAALLLAMIILTLITTLAASMVWQQWRAVQVEAAERARTQSAWILTGALDWARLILREDAKSNSNHPVDHLGEPWAVPLAEARLSSFLAADKNNNADDGSGLDAFLSGSIADLQARYNLRNLVQENKLKTDELQVLQRLCELAGVPQSTAQRIGEGLAAAWTGAPNAAVAPQTVEQLVWLGVDPGELKRLLPFVVLLPEPTQVNVNTAPREVIAAVVDQMDVGTAERLVQMRQREPFKDPGAIATIAGLQGENPVSRLSVRSGYFEVQGQVRLGDRVLQERSLVRRPAGGGASEVLRRERVNLLAGS
ncbi:MAG: type II secretion system minor pseudopilin GspK [Pseudomonadota bacterium]